MTLGPAAAWITPEGWRLDLRAARRGTVLDFAIDRARPDVTCRFERQTSEVQHFFLGSDSSRWQSDVPTYERARLAAVRPGVDLVLRTQEGLLEYDFELSSGADLEALSIDVQGSEGLAISDDGSLLIRTELGLLRQNAPLTWSTDREGVRTVRECRFELRGVARFGFVVSEWDGAEALTIDPGLEWSSFLGHDDVDDPADIAVDSMGRSVVTGTTRSYDFPVSPGAYDFFLSGFNDVFVTCFAADGSGYAWSTFLGASDGEFVAEIHVALDGKLTLAGQTDSTDFPTTPGAHDPVHDAGTDAFVSRLSRDGSELLASTLLGSNGTDIVRGLDRLPSGDVVVVGTTNSNLFPTSISAFQSSISGTGGSGFVTRLRSDLSGIVWSSFLGGSAADRPNSVRFTASEDVQICGETLSFDFPTQGAFDSILSGVSDGFLCEVHSSGAALSWSTLLGGSLEDSIVAFGELSPGVWAVGGTTSSLDFPTSASAVQPANGGGIDAFVAVLSNSGGSLDWATYLGHENTDELTDLKVDSTGRPVAAGSTDSRFFPTTPWAYQPYFRGPYVAGATGGDGWMSRLEPDGSALVYSSFIGGPDHDELAGLSLSGEDQCHLAGRTFSSSFPTTPGAVDRFYDFSGFGDGFAMSLDFAEHPYAFGSSKLSSNFSEPYLYWNGFPSLSRNDFQIAVDSACPSTGLGTLIVGANQINLPQGTGARYVGAPFRRVGSSPIGLFGSATIDVPVQPWMVGKTLFYQFCFYDPGAPNGLGLSNGMVVRFHP